MHQKVLDSEGVWARQRPRNCLAQEKYVKWMVHCWSKNVVFLNYGPDIAHKVKGQMLNLPILNQHTQTLFLQNTCPMQEYMWKGSLEAGSKNRTNSCTFKLEVFNGSRVHQWREKQSGCFRSRIHYQEQKNKMMGTF